MKYFAYGSNLNVKQMTGRCPGASLKESALLRGWQYYINGNGYAGIEKNINSKVWGRLWTVSEENLKSLDRYEAVALGYYDRTSIEVEIIATGEMEEAWVYLSNDKNYGVPSDEYQKIVMDGAHEVGMPEDEFCNLQSWARGNKFRDNSS